MDTTAIVQTSSSFGELAGYALVLLVIFVGLSLLWNGWPRFRKKE